MSWMLGLFQRLPATFIQNDSVMNWLLEEDVEKGLTPELVRTRSFPAQATFGYKSSESWYKRKDNVLIVPSRIVDNFALCYVGSKRL